MRESHPVRSGHSRAVPLWECVDCPMPESMRNRPVLHNDSIKYHSKKQGKRRVKFIFTSLLFCIFMAQSMSSLAEEKVRLARIENLAEQIIGEKIAHKIFGRIGVPLEVFPCPGLRGNQICAAKAVDGEMMRIFSYGMMNPGLTRVPTPYYALETTVFVRRGADVVVNSANDLQKYKLVVVRGVQHTRDITDGLPNVEVVNGSKEMMAFLAAGRADIALANRIDGLSVLKAERIDDVRPLLTLAKHELYIYLNGNRKELVPRLDDAIRSMRASGELETLAAASEREYMDSIP